MEEKHGVPALFSFFILGLGQLIKRHYRKFLLLWLLQITLVVLIIITRHTLIYEIAVLSSILIMLIAWIWSIQDAYNS